MKSKLLILIVALAAYVMCGANAIAQKKPVEQTGQAPQTPQTPKPPKIEKTVKTKIKVSKTVELEERAVAVEPGVVITLCMDSGKVTVRGGDRREVRAHIPKGTAIDFGHASEADAASPAKRLELMIAEEPDEDEGGPHFGQCTGAADIELEVPRDATLFFKSDDAHFDVDAVAEAHIGTNGGRISLRHVTRAIEATSNEGDILLENSSGRVRLESFNGLVEAINVSRIAESDFFRAKSISNDVMLENVNHSRVEVTTISGELTMRGPLARTGIYDLRTTSGDITLTMPVDSSFKLTAKVSEGGEIVTDFPLKYTGGISSIGLLSAGRMVGVYGKGDATINLVSFSGTLRLRKQ